MATRLRILQGFFAFLHEQGAIAQAPIRFPRHHILVPQGLPPHGGRRGRGVLRVIDAVRDRTMFLLMPAVWPAREREGPLVWAALDFAEGTVRIDNSKGHVDRVVYLAPDVAKALQQWRRLQGAAPRYIFPSRVTRRGASR